MKSSTVLDLFCLPKGCCCIIFCTVLPLSEHMLLVNAWVISLKMTNWSDVCICMNTLKSWQGLQRQWLQPLSKAGNELCCFPSGVRTLHSSILDGWEQTHTAGMRFPVLSQGRNEAWKSGKALSRLALKSYTVELGNGTSGLHLCSLWWTQGLLTN